MSESVPSSPAEKKRKQPIVRLISALLLAVTGVIGVIAACKTITEIRAEKHIYRDLSAVPGNEFGLLLGTSRTINGRENPYFTQRIKAAVALYRSGKIKYILASGAVHGAPPYYDGPAAMKAALIAAGVPAARIIRDGYGYRTLDSVYRAKDVFGLKSFTAISQYGHTARAVCLALHRDLKVTGFVAADSGIPADNLYNNLRESLAKVKMMLDLYVLNTRPRFPKTVPLSGNLLKFSESQCRN
ncbi:MAG: ElyC/SanA/YdcF family protein [Victivallaceae bacterium]|nr:ElyC/SanA/YdcF family protein [Victivallaceae bacterium]